MKTIKLFTAIMLMFAMSISFVSCGKSDDENDDATEDTNYTRLVEGDWVCGEETYRFDGFREGKYSYSDYIIGTLTYGFQGTDIGMTIHYINYKENYAYQNNVWGTYDPKRKVIIIDEKVFYKAK